MLLGFAVFLLSNLVGSFVGYFVHRAMHHEWAGPLYRGHMEHHLELYPKGKLTSDSYTVAKWYNSGPVLFTPAALLVIGLGGLACWALGGSLWLFGVFSVGLVGFGLANDYVHDSFHLRRHWLHKFPFYRGLRRQHFEHHNDMTKNFGILVMQWDGVFKTKS